jgi:hypothetical protein
MSAYYWQMPKFERPATPCAALENRIFMASTLAKTKMSKTGNESTNRRFFQGFDKHGTKWFFDFVFSFKNLESPHIGLCRPQHQHLSGTCNCLHLFIFHCEDGIAK